MTPGRVVIITSRNSIARNCYKLHAISTAYIAPPYNTRDVYVSATRLSQKGIPTPSRTMQLRSSEQSTNNTTLVRKGTNLVVAPMAKRIPVSLRETARIKGRVALRTTKTRFVPRLTNGLHLDYIPTSRELEFGVNDLFNRSHLLCKVHVLVATWALGSSTTPLSHRATCRGGTQFTHERRPVPRAGSACGQWCNPARADCPVPTDGVSTAKSCRTTTQGGC
jgi:hypothetical protein